MGAVREFPTKKDEKWRYAPVKELTAAFNGAVPAGSGVITAAQLAALICDTQQEVRLVWVNGVFDAELSASELPVGVHLDGDELTVEAGITLAETLHLVECGVPGPEATLSSPRMLVDVGNRSSVSIVQSLCALDGVMVTDLEMQIRTGDSSKVHLTRVQTEPITTVHVGHTDVHLGRDAEFDVVDINVGGDIARHEMDVHFDAPGARFGAHGLFLPVGSQQHDTVITVDHAASHCASQQDVRGVVDDSASGSFIGHIVVRHGVVDTDAHQTNKNMALTRTAGVNSRPWLEILADDVRCTHGSTVGQLDEDALFYMRSRGIGEDEGRSILIDAFIALIVDAIPNELLRARVGTLVRRHLAGGRP